MIYEVLQSVGFNWHVAVLNFINFVIIFLLLRKFFFGKIAKTMHERDQKIRLGLEDAQKAKDRLNGAELAAADIIDKAETESAHILQKSAEKGEGLARDIQLKAEHEAEALKKRLKDAINNSEDKVYAELANAAPELLRTFYKDVLGQSFDSKVDKQYILNFFKKNA